MWNGTELFLRVSFLPIDDIDFIFSWTYPIFLWIIKNRYFNRDLILRMNMHGICAVKNLQIWRRDDLKIYQIDII